METYTKQGARNAPATYTCRKCSEELILDDVENGDDVACPECSELIPEDALPRGRNCKKPGPHGCGKCEGCSEWDRKIDRLLEREG